MRPVEIATIAAVSATAMFGFGYIMGAVVESRATKDVMNKFLRKQEIYSSSIFTTTIIIPTENNDKPLQ